MEMCSLLPPHSSLFDTVIMDIFWTHCDDPFKRGPSPPSSSSSSSPQPLRLRTPARRKQKTQMEGGRERRSDGPLQNEMSWFLGSSFSLAIIPDITSQTFTHVLNFSDVC